MIERVDHTQLTETTGSIVFHLVDENGDYRTVQGTTFINENQELQGITSQSIRELPLIESLFSNRDKKIIEVEFDHFNEIYDRDRNQTINQRAYEEIQKIKNENKFSRRISDIIQRII